MRELVRRTVTMENGDRVDVFETPSGEGVCPVCGCLIPGGPAWYQWADMKMAFPLDGGTCSCCRTQWGYHDMMGEDKSIGAQVRLWAKLRRAWLDEVGWSESALLQLRESLGIGELEARSAT